MTDHTPNSKVSRLEVVSTGARRRWTLEEKQRIVAESYGGPRDAADILRFGGFRHLAEEQETKHRRQALASALANLNPRERNIFTARWLSEESATLEELAAKSKPGPLDLR
jgi:DNA-directed RNA polymerase sigma subunit (sigma70/sigma32)